MDEELSWKFREKLELDSCIIYRNIYLQSKIKLQAVFAFKV